MSFLSVVGEVMEECNETEACQMPAPSVCKMVSGMPPFYEGQKQFQLFGSHSATAPWLQGCFSKLASWGNLGSASVPCRLAVFQRMLHKLSDHSKAEPARRFLSLQTAPPSLTCETLAEASIGPEFGDRGCQRHPQKSRSCG